MTTEKQSILERFGINKEEFEKTKDILPTFDFSNLAVGESVVLTIDEETPKPVEHENKFKKGENTKTFVLPVIVHQVNRLGDHNEPFVVPMNDEKMTLWLSSKSLSMNLVKIFEETGKVKGTTVKIVKSSAIYKNYGENTCYNVFLA